MPTVWRTAQVAAQSPWRVKEQHQPLILDSRRCSSRWSRADGSDDGCGDDGYDDSREPFLCAAAPAPGEYCFSPAAAPVGAPGRQGDPAVRWGPRRGLPVPHPVETPECGRELERDSIPGEAALSLSVFEYPTSPSCAALKPEDGEEVAAVMEVTLECRGSTGTPPVSYSWQRTDGGEQPYICKPGSSVCERSVSPADRNSTYMCTARNPVGAEFCHVMVHAASRPEKHIERSTFTIVVIILAFLLMLAIVLAVTLWWRGGQAGKC
ncbi:uncharacterized protein LOC116948223 isoform X3 [Petromyzon marinus]|uniref:uncharacterized protein LOC116948223 isoform X3 n=1 Tax=Petromyzon marinus TaxID=7757 RepID=UPI003F6EED5C